LETYKLFEKKFVGARQPLVLWGKIYHLWKKKGLRGLLLECAKINLRTSNLGTRPSFPVEKNTETKGASNWLFFYAMNDLLRRDVAVNLTNIIEAGESGYNAIKRRWV
jgi:hypothetical protein